MYIFSKFFPDLQPYYLGAIPAIWSLTQKRSSTARKKQFQKMLPQQILQMMSGKATICQVCCWANICYLEKKQVKKKPHFLLLTKLVKFCLCLSLLHIIYTLSGCFNCFSFFSSCIHSPSTLVFIGKPSLLFDKLSCFLLHLWDWILNIYLLVWPFLLLFKRLHFLLTLLSFSNNQGQSSQRQMGQWWYLVEQKTMGRCRCVLSFSLQERW